MIGRTPRLLAIVALLWVGTLFGYAWEGIATPLADELGRGATALGILLAANPLGVTIGGLVLARLVPPARRERLVVPPGRALAACRCWSAGWSAASPAPGAVPFAVLVGLLFVSGLGAAWLDPAERRRSCRPCRRAYRGRAFGVAVSGLYGVQGIGALGAGARGRGRARPAASWRSAAALGLIAVIPPLLAYRRTQGHMAPDARG